MKDGKSRFMMIRSWRTKPWFIAIRVCISRGNSNNNNDDDDDGDDDDDYNSNICVYIAFCARRIFVPRLYSHPRGQLQRAFCNRFLSLSLVLSVSLSYIIQKYKIKNTKIRRDGRTRDLSHSILVNSSRPQRRPNILTVVYNVGLGGRPVEINTIFNIGTTTI